MAYKDKSKQIGMIAGVCFLIAAIVHFADLIYPYGSAWVEIAAIDDFWIIISLIMFSASAFSMNKKLAIASSSVMSAYRIYYMVKYHSYYDSAVFAAAAVSLIAVLCLCSKRKSVIKMVWFIPGMLMLSRANGRVKLVKYAFELMRAGGYEHDSVAFGLKLSQITIKAIFLGVTFWALQVMGFFLLALAFKTEASAGSPDFSTVGAPAVIQSTESPVTFDTADRLKKYKELLDAGILTQEEFEEKKKALLK